MLLRLITFLTVTLSLHTAIAAQITVNALPGDSGCTLVNAILSANNDASFGGCANGSGDDIVSLPSSLGDHVFTDTVFDNDALPLITSNITVRGITDRAVIRRQGTNRMRFFSVGANAVLTLENLHLISGAAVIDSFDPNGGAIKVRPTATLFLLSSIVENSNAEGFSGGAITSDEARVVIFDSILRDNHAFRAGAIDARSSNLTIGESIVEDNRSIDDSGGISVSSGELEINDSSIRRNRTEGRRGGGISLLEANAIIRRSLIANNSAEAILPSLAGATSGGGIWVNGIDGTEAQVISIFDSTITGNKATLGSGLDIFLRENRRVNVFNTTIAFNDVFDENPSLESSGVQIGSGQTEASTGLRFINSIVTGNSSSSSSTGREIAASILEANNQLTFLNSLIGHSGISNSDAIRTPILINLPSLGDGTNILATSDGNQPTPLNRIISSRLRNNVHPLPANSPAIDSATDGDFFDVFLNPIVVRFWAPGCRGEVTEATFVPPPFRNDQLGNPRPVGNSCDMGAAEFVDEVNCYVVKTANDNVVNFCL